MAATTPPPLYDLDFLTVKRMAQTTQIDPLMQPPTFE